MKKESKTEEDGSYHTAQIGLGDEEESLEIEEERRAKNGLNLDLIWIEIGVKNSRNVPARPVMGTIFVVYIMCQYVCRVQNA